MMRTGLGRRHLARARCREVAVHRPACSSRCSDELPSTLGPPFRHVLVAATLDLLRGCRAGDVVEMAPRIARLAVAQKVTRADPSECTNAAPHHEMAPLVVAIAPPGVGCHRHLWRGKRSRSGRGRPQYVCVLAGRRLYARHWMHCDFGCRVPRGWGRVEEGQGSGGWCRTACRGSPVLTSWSPLCVSAPVRS